MEYDSGKVAEWEEKIFGCGADDIRSRSLCV